MNTLFTAIWVVMAIVGIRVIWIWARRGGTVDLKPIDADLVPRSLRDRAAEGSAFRCGFEVRAPRSFVCTGPVGRCVVDQDVLAVQALQGTYAVVPRYEVVVDVKGSRLLNPKVHLTGDGIDLLISPYDWQEAERLLQTTGWLPTS